MDITARLVEEGLPEEEVGRPDEDRDVDDSELTELDPKLSDEGCTADDDDDDDDVGWDVTLARLLELDSTLDV